MSKDLIRDVEIIEPPIEELTKKNSWLRKTCLNSCLTTILFIAILIGGLKLYLGSGPKNIKRLPKNYPLEIPVYDEYNTSKVVFISGQYKSRSLKLTGIFSQIILPDEFLSGLDTENPYHTSTVNQKIINTWRFASGSTVDNRDTVKIEWSNKEVNTEEIIAFYENKLKESGFIITTEKTATYQKINFRKDTTDGVVYIKPTDSIFLLVNF
jgi:hypothetical protein